MPVGSPSSLIWLRDDLRLDDHPALTAAAASGPLAAVFVLETGDGAPRTLGGAARWWLHHSLSALAADLSARGVRLILRTGDPRRIIPEIAERAGARSVHWSRRYRPDTTHIDASVKQALADAGIAAHSHAGSLLAEPWTIRTGSGGPFQVFTPYLRALRTALAANAQSPLPVPAITGAAVQPDLPSDRLEDWALLPSRPDWAGGLRAAWTPGEAGARARLAAFLDKGLRGYSEGRDFPGIEGTSRLSPHLRFGEISPRRAWHAATAAAHRDPRLAGDAEKFQAELGWRDFSASLLFHFDRFATDNFKPAFDRFPWADAPAHVQAWRRGQTGYPIVDAGMRQLWQTGWMHNRVRMIVGSFLVKHLLTHWRTGEDWFWDTLVDADSANNAAGWQWIAGSGADAAPYFRVFNPVAQGQKFDPEGAYVRQFVPELARLPAKLIHEPWSAPRELLAHAGVRLGATYPFPVVDHASARQRALDAFASLKSSAGDIAA